MIAALLEYRISTRLAAPPEPVWAAAVTPQGINAELAPWLRMSVPPGGLDLDAGRLSPPVRLGRSWILLFGVLPVDYDDLGIERLVEGHFRERSTTSTLSVWQHERWVEPDGPGCVVTDRLRFRPRRLLAAVPGGPRLASAVVRVLFTHRHRRLVARWGEGSGGDPRAGTER